MYKPLLSTLIALTAAAASYAQAPVLTAANFNPVIGNAFYITEADTTAFNPGPSGANQVWNFTGLITRKYDTGLIKDCAAVTPTCTSFITAGSPNMVQTVPAPLKLVDYIEANTDSISHWGYYQAADTNLKFTDPLKNMKYPFTYMTTFTDSFKGSYQLGTIPVVGGPLNFMERGEITVTCDGWGKLMLPGRTDTVLRVHMTEVHRDSAHIALPIGSPIDSVVTLTVDQYVWYKPGVHTALLLYTTATLQSSTTPVYKLVAYVAKDNTGVNDITGTEAKIDLFPNPSKGLLNVSWADMTTGNVAVTVSDMAGRSVLHTNMDVRSASGKAELNLQNAAPGIYFVTVKADNVNYKGKVVIE